jgi:hypothetical protein
MKDVVFVSVAFGDLYLAQQDRLKESILAIYPDANIMFYRDVLPNGSKPFLESLYGFKAHAIAEAKRFFKKIIWLDPAMILCGKIDVLFDHNMVAVKDDNLLHNLVSNNCLNYYLTTREEIELNQLHLVGGSLYYFDFNIEVSDLVFRSWHHAEILNIFGSQHEAATEQLQGHRYDEACMALSMNQAGVVPVNPDQIGYCTGLNSVFSKKHFK